MSSEEFTENNDIDEPCENISALHQFTIYLIISVFIIVAVVSLSIVFRVVQLGQKTRTPPQRRMYVGTRARQSLSQTEPTIYVSPNNLPPPPKYECLAPPSYDEVVGVHYPQYQQPITQPITAAMALNQMPITTAVALSQAPITTLAQNAQSSQNSTDATVITVTSEVRTSVQATSS